MKHDIHNRQISWKLQEVTYIVSEVHEVWPTNGLKWNDHCTHPP